MSKLKIPSGTMCGYSLIKDSLQENEYWLNYLKSVTNPFMLNN